MLSTNSKFIDNQDDSCGMSNSYGCQSEYEDNNFEVKEELIDYEEISNRENVVVGKTTYQSYAPYKYFDNKDDAIKELSEKQEDESSEDCEEDPVRKYKWKYRQTYNELIYYYNCAHKGCKVSLKLIRDPPGKEKGTWALCSSDGQHDHSRTVMIRMPGLEPAVHKLVCQYDKAGLMPKRMLTMIRAAGYEPPPISQINQALKTIRKQARKKANGSTEACFSLQYIRKYVEKNSVSPEEIVKLDLDKVFVAKFEYELQPIIKFRLFVTTKRMLLFTRYNKHCLFGATNNIVDEKIPVLTIGTTDYCKSFHPFGLGICSHQTGKDFEFVFKSVRDAAKMYTGINYSPDVLIAESAKEITEGFTAAFGHPRKRIICWEHVIRNIDVNLQKVDKQFRDEIRAGIFKIQANSHSNTIQATFSLFDQEWRKKYNAAVNAFLDYFSTNWTKDGKNGWYEGFCEGLPSTTNAIKAAFTEIKSRPLTDFLDSLGVENGLVLEWSLERAPKLPIRDSSVNWTSLALSRKIKIYNFKPRVDNTPLFNACDNKKKNKTVVKLIVDESPIYFIPAGNATESNPVETCNRYLKLWKNDKWANLSDYIDFISSHHVVKFNEKKWENSLCTCTQAREKNYCTHVLTLSSKSKTKEDIMDTVREKEMSHSLTKSQTTEQQPVTPIKSENLTASEQSKKRHTTDEQSSKKMRTQLHESSSTQNIYFCDDI